MFSVVQPTEYGTVHTIDEFKELLKVAKQCYLYSHESLLFLLFLLIIRKFFEHDIRFDIDYDRVFNIVPSPKCDLGDITTAVGVNILSLRAQRSNENCRNGWFSCLRLVYSVASLNVCNQSVFNINTGEYNVLKFNNK